MTKDRVSVFKHISKGGKACSGGRCRSTSPPGKTGRKGSAQKATRVPPASPPSSTPHPRRTAGQMLPWLPSFPVLPELRHPRGHRTPWNLQQTFRRAPRLHHASLGVVLERMVSWGRRDTNLPDGVRFLASRHRKWDRAAAAAAGTKWRRETG